MSTVSMSHLRRCARIICGVALTAAFLIASIAYADSYGTPGVVVELKVNEPSADDYGVERGHVVFDEGGLKRRYQWGGTACSGRNLSEANIDILVNAMRSATSITPSYKPGAAQVRCIVGFRIGG